MKYKHLTEGLLALALLAVTFVPAANAAVYNGYVSVSRQGNNLTFIMLQIANDDVPLASVDLARITLVILPKGETTTVSYSVPAGLIYRDSAGITFTLDRRDLPASKADDSWVDGFVVLGGVSYTFEAAGPGWGWGNIH